jgi:hypothetical protein
MGESGPGRRRFLGTTEGDAMKSRSTALALVAVGGLAGLASGCAGGSSQRSAIATGSAPATYAETSAADSAGAATEGGESIQPAPDRPGLGTEFGENVYSRVTESPFERAGSDPFAAVAIHYNDAEGVQAQADYRGGGLAPISASTPYGGITIALTDDVGNPLQGFAAAGRTYVVGEAGRRYNLRITNQTAGRYEVVASVDGLDVIDGKQATPGKRGYILAPNSTLTIDGFRTSEESVAAFRFAAVRDSYAARTGDDRNVGVVGFAFFAERGSRWTTDELARRESADPFPGRYATPP